MRDAVRRSECAGADGIFTGDGANRLAALPTAPDRQAARRRVAARGELLPDACRSARRARAGRPAGEDGEGSGR